MDVDGINVEAVTGWLRDRTEVEPPLTFEVIQGGRSNLTYTVTDAAGQRLVLRRPPLHGVIESAHDMGREHRIMAALADSDVPVPDLVGHEPDDAVTGAPFYVMHHVDGIVARNIGVVEEHLRPDVRVAVTDNLVDVLARLHDLEPDDIGLGDLGRREAYLARQLRRWHGQLEQSRTRQLPRLDEVHKLLVERAPPQQGSAIVHGDYRLDNLILDPDTGRVRAVLDWELTTLGDPLADVGLLLCYWARPGDPTVPLPDAPTLADGFPEREAVVERYATRSDRDLSPIRYYQAFGYWKLACILEGVYSRYASGAYGQTDGSFEVFGQVVVELGDRAAEAIAEVDV